VKTKRKLASQTRSPINEDQPKFLIVAGPNGSGKTTVFESTILQDIGRAVWIINPDLLAIRITKVESLGIRAANLEAVRRIERWLKASIQAHQTIGVETVLSTAKYRKLVRLAKSRKFEIVLVYVLLNSARLNVARVALRVKKGGHHVPVRKILSRRVRSLRQLPWFLHHADVAWIYDNSGSAPKLVATKDKGGVLIDPGAMPEIMKAAVASLRLRD
jgi:predicted ABC-type ATPase